MTIEILDKAEDDLVNGYKFYEQQQPGLGAYLRDSLKIHGGVHRVVYRNYHRVLSKRFPFAIFYTVYDEMVSIHAVVDCRRKPTWITGHLKSD